MATEIRELGGRQTVFRDGTQLGGFQTREEAQSFIQERGLEAPVAQPAQPAGTTAGADVTPEIPDTIGSDALSSGITRDDILGFVQGQQAQQQAIIDASQPTEEITALRQQGLDVASRIRELDTATLEGQLGVEGQGRGMTFASVSGQQRAIGRESAIQRQALTNELQAVTGQLNAAIDAQATQVDLLSKQLQFSQQNFQNLATLSELTQPDVLSTHIDEQTGEVTAFVQDPQTGEVTQKNIGAVSPEKVADFTPSGTFTNDKGEVVAWGTNAEGQIETHVVGQERTQRNTQMVTIGNQAVLVDTDTGEVISRIGGGGTGGGTPVGTFDQPVSPDELTSEQLNQLSGTSRAVLQNPGAFKGLTPTVQGQVLEELGTLGIDASSLFPDPAQANAARAAFTVVRDGTRALDFMEQSSLFFDDEGEPAGGTINAGQRWFASKIPGTEAFEVAKSIQSVKDNIGIDALLNIKREGSGLGQVPQSQLETLQGLLGRLDITRRPDLLRQDIDDALAMYQDIIDKSGDEVLQVVGRDPGQSTNEGALMTPSEQQGQQQGGQFGTAQVYQAPDGTVFVQGSDGLYYPQQ